MCMNYKGNDSCISQIDSLDVHCSIMLYHENISVISNPRSVFIETNVNLGFK